MFWVYPIGGGRAARLGAALSAEGARLEAPRGWGLGRGLPLYSRLGDLGERRKLPQRLWYIMGLQNDTDGTKISHSSCKLLRFYLMRQPCNIMYCIFRSTHPIANSNPLAADLSVVHCSGVTSDSGPLGKIFFLGPLPYTSTVPGSNKLDPCEKQW